MISDEHYAGASPAPDAGASPYTPCESCGAPLDAQQRYCLNCGTRRKHASDPAARFLANASRRQKPPAATAVAPRGGSISVFTLAAILLIPLALGLGVLVGHSSSSSTPNAKLLSALTSGRNSGASGDTASSSPGGSSASASTDVSQLVTGSWTRSSGYAVELSSLPQGTSAGAAAKAEQTDRTKGAKSLGVLATSAYRISPAPKGAYVIYSGSYATTEAARQALSALKGHFPHALVIHVAIPTTASSNTKVVAHTRYGTAHQVVGYKPSASDLAKGAQEAAQDAKSTGKDASGAGLPDVVSVP